MVSFSFHFILFLCHDSFPVQPTEIKLNGNYFFPSNISLFTKNQPDSYFWIITDQKGSSSIFFVVVVLGLFWKFIFQVFNLPSLNVLEQLQRDFREYLRAEPGGLQVWFNRPTTETAKIQKHESDKLTGDVAMNKPTLKHSPHLHCDQTPSRAGTLSHRTDS